MDHRVDGSVWLKTEEPADRFLLDKVELTRMQLTRMPCFAADAHALLCS